MPTPMSTGPKTFPIVEIFGPVTQGEGLFIGQQTHFIRTGGCDYRCGWCDSLHAVLPDRVKENAVMMNEEEIVERVAGINNHTRMVTISGGNPAMHRFDNLVEYLQDRGFKVIVETQGTVYNTWLLDCDAITISPKPPSSGNPTSVDTLAKFMKDLRRARTPMNLKIVIFTHDDYDYAVNLLEDIQIRVTSNKVHPLFEAITFQVGTPQHIQHPALLTTRILDDLKTLLERVNRDPHLAEVRVLPQLHTLLYGHRQGV